MEIINKSKRDFGSFHSSNVEELIHSLDSDYKSPEYNVKFDLHFYKSLQLHTKFGSDELKQTLFYLSGEFCFLNHGAFGLTFKPVVSYVQKWKEFAESQPLRFYDRLIMPLLVDLTRKLSSDVFGCKANELVLVDNSTFAFNSIVNSVHLKQGEKFLIFSSTYGVYKKILREKCLECGAVLIEEQIKFPIIDEKQLHETFLNKLSEILLNDCEKKIKFILVDHIPSNQPFLVPILKMSDLCKSLRADVCFIVDAAHSLGSVTDFKLEQLPNVDLLFGNFHKWFCGPKGTGYLFKNERFDGSRIKPAVQSHGLNAGFNSEFVWSGLKDYSNFLGLYATMLIWTQCFDTFNTPINYCIALMRESSEYLKNSWSTEFLVHPDFCTTMICVKLPFGFVQNVLKMSFNNNLDRLNYDQAELVQNFFYFNYNIEVPVKCIQNELYVRISCHIYNNLNDYEKLANAVLENI